MTAHTYIPDEPSCIKVFDVIDTGKRRARSCTSRTEYCSIRRTKHVFLPARERCCRSRSEGVVSGGLQIGEVSFDQTLGVNSPTGLSRFPTSHRRLLAPGSSGALITIPLGRHISFSPLYKSVRGEYPHRGVLRYKQVA